MLEPGCIAALLAALEADPGSAACSRGSSSSRETDAATVDARPPLQRRPGARPGRPRGRDGSGRGAAAARTSRREIFGVCGAACLLRRELFDRLGGYDESYFAFYEDVDLNVRARIAGWRFGYVPEAVVWHVGNASWQAGFARPSAENARLVARNRIATQAKFMPAGALPRIARGRGRGARSRGRAAPFGPTLRGKLEGLRSAAPLARASAAGSPRGRPRAPALARRWLGWAG